MFDQKNNLLTRIGRYYSPPVFRGEIRCDLHPRLSLNNNKICIDAIDNDVRVIKVLDISSFISDK